MPRLAPSPARGPRVRASETTSSTAGPGVKQRTVSVAQKRSHACSDIDGGATFCTSVSEALGLVHVPTSRCGILQRGNDLSRLADAARRSRPMAVGGAGARLLGRE